jgi:putative ABC transport system substrate-binding protein
VIVTGGGPAPTFAAKSATATIPILFSPIADDPVKLGLVASLARPGGNVTGISILLTELATKRLELLREMVPAITRVAALVSPAEASNTEATLKDLETASRLMGLEIKALKASTSGEINAAFATLEAERARRHFRRTRFFLHHPASPIGAAGDAAPDPYDLSNPAVRGSRGADELWT